MKIFSLMENTAGGYGCSYEHGLSIYVETEAHCLLVDTGASPAFLDNAQKLGVDLTKVDTLILSHGHYDHAGGILAFAKINPTARIYLKKTAVGEYYHVSEQEERYIGIDKAIAELPQITFVEGNLKIDEELFLFTDIPEKYPRAKGTKVLMEKRENGWCQDSFDHEQCLVISQEEKQILLSGCAHNGILNILEEYQRLFDREPDMVISGFHLMQDQGYGPEEKEAIQDLAKSLQKIKAVFYTGHCTGQEAYGWMKEIMGNQLHELHSGVKIFDSDMKADMEKTGLVLEGGGMRGIYTAGVLDVFMEHGITFDGVIGVSAGAIHGSTYVAGQKGRNIRYYKKYCSDKRFMSWRNFITTGDMVGEQFCYHELPDILDPVDYEAFKNSDTDFYVTCSNLETGKAEYIQIRDLRSEMEPLRASASLPYVTKIVDVNGKKLLDGGCCDSIPVEAFRKMGYSRTVVVLTQHDGYVKKPQNMALSKLLYRKYPKFIRAWKNRYKKYNQTLRKIRELEAEGKIFVIRPSQKLTIGRIEHNPNEIQRVYDIGRRDAAKQMEALKKFLECKAKTE